jgi:hypothetical protein
MTSKHIAITGSTPVRQLPWNEGGPTAPRSMRNKAYPALALGLTALTAAVLLPAVRLNATSADAPGPGDLVQILQTVSSIQVEAEVCIRLYPSSAETSLPTDALPTVGTAIFADSGTAWRIQNDFDPARIRFLPSVDSSFDGDATVITLLRDSMKASITTAGEQDVPYTQVCHPWLRLGMWLQSDPASYRHAITRTDLFQAHPSLLDLPEAGWNQTEFQGEAVDATLIDYGSGFPSYRILTPPGDHMRPLCIEAYAPNGLLNHQVLFRNWAIPAWGQDSAVQPIELPYTVVLLAYTPLGELCADITTTITAGSVDEPVSASSLVTPLDGAISLFDEDTRTNIW